MFRYYIWHLIYVLDDLDCFQFVWQQKKQQQQIECLRLIVYVRLYLWYKQASNQAQTKIIP